MTDNESKIEAGLIIEVTIVGSGPPGEKGEPYRYEDFTPEQLEALRGPAGRDGHDGADGPPGAKGDPFTYEDFTPEQLEALRGRAGKDGVDGKDGAPGKDGSDADVTAENIANALGYTPADNKTVLQLQEALIGVSDLIGGEA